MEKKISRFDQETDREHSDAEKYTLREKLFGTKAVYPMWVADMEFEVAPAIKTALQERAKEGVFGYALPEQELFEVAQKWVKERHGVDVPWDHFYASSSIVTSMSAMVEAFCSVNEAVCVLTPIYPPFLEVVQSQERELMTIELIVKDHKYTIDFDALEEAFKRSRLFLFCNPHNPVGRVWDQDELSAFASLALRYDVTIVSDDAHADIVRAIHKYTHLSRVNAQIHDRLITLVGPGKGFNVSGLATTLFYSHNKELLGKVTKVMHQRHIIAGNIMGYVALKAAYTHSQEWLNELNAYLDINMSHARDYINKECIPLFAYESEGTYLLWIDCKALGLGDKALKEFFVTKCGLGLSLGRSFGNAGRGHMRMNCAVPFKELHAALERIKEGLKSLKRKA